MGLEDLPVGGDNKVISAHAKRVRALGFGVREDSDVCSERTGELNPHVAKSTEANDADLLAGASAPLFER